MTMPSRPGARRITVRDHGYACDHGYFVPHVSGNSGDDGYVLCPGGRPLTLEKVRPGGYADMVEHEGTVWLEVDA